VTYLTKEQILTADDIHYEDVDVPGWGGTVRIAEMNGNARDSHAAMLYNRGKGTNFESMRAKLVAFSIVDDEGKLMFSPQDIVELGQKCYKSLDVVYEAADRLNAVSDAAMEETAKN
jgi:hypothetical protein